MFAAGLAFIAPPAAGGGGGGGPTLTPISGATDDFTRADGALGANWTDQGDFSSTVNLSIAGNAFRCPSGFPAYARWNGTGAGSITDDHYITVTVSGITGGNDEIGISARNNGATSAACYNLRIRDGLTTLLERIAANAVAATLDTRTIAWANGDTATIACIGTTIYVYRNGAVVYSVTDANLTTGRPGIYAKQGFSDSIRGDNSVIGNVT